MNSEKLLRRWPVPAIPTARGGEHHGGAKPRTPAPPWRTFSCLLSSSQTAAGIVSKLFRLPGKILHFSGAGRGFASVDPGLHLESPPISFGNHLAESAGGIGSKHGDRTSAEASAR